MNELQFWHWIATGGVTVILTILWWWVRSVSDDMKTKLSREEFASYLQDAKASRNEIRETLVKLFERADNHEKLDAVRFESVIKDFNGGMQRLSEKISDTQVNILTKLNDKMDKGK